MAMPAFSFGNANHAGHISNCKKAGKKPFTPKLLLTLSSLLQINATAGIGPLLVHSFQIVDKKNNRELYSFIWLFCLFILDKRVFCLQTMLSLRKFPELTRVSRDKHHWVSQEQQAFQMNGFCVNGCEVKWQCDTLFYMNFNQPLGCSYLYLCHPHLYKDTRLKRKVTM